MTTPEVSVVMPVLAPHPVYFRQAVESVLTQTLSNIELVIVEDPSSSSAAELLADIRDPRIRLHTNAARTSLVKQRNLTLEMARAEWIAVLDADDVCEPHRLETQVACVRENPALDVLGSQLAIIDGDGRRIGFRPYPTQHQEIAQALRRFNAFGHSSVLFRKQAILEAGGYRYDRYIGLEDYELWCRLLTRQLQFANHPEALVQYRVQSQQIKSTRLRDQLHGTLEVKSLYWSGERDFRARARIWAERMMLHLPAQLVLSMFRWTQFKPTLAANAHTPKQKCSNAGSQVHGGREVRCE